jgi:hypothetical protein
MNMKKCKVCKKPFTPKFNTLQPTCDVPCAIELTKIQQEKEQKKENRAARKKLRESDRSWWMAEAQKYFNRWIRYRDRNEPCISCGETRDLKYDAGHYRSVGACPELRFDERNVNKQCSFKCNQTRTGNVLEYRIGLVKKIGLEAVEELEGPHDPKKYTIDDLREIRDKYKALCKDRS